MKNNKYILFCGGDKRLYTAMRCFEEIGFTCNAFKCDYPSDKSDCSYEDMRKAEIVVLPIPSFKTDYSLNTSSTISDISAEHLFAKLKPGADVFGGMIPEFIYTAAREYNITVHDYGAREDFAVMNAIPTAEAAIMISSKCSPKTIFGSDYSIIGYGRIGKALASRLRFLGGNVTVASRSSSSQSNAYCDGFKAVKLYNYLSSTVKCDTLFNTVPCRIIGKDAVKDSSAQFIDLASSPGGFSEEAEEILGNKLIKALALPGKYSPETAGEIIYKTVKNMIEEIGG